ncbi:MAG: class I SAM-dependent methyltransferase [Acidimicrobiales bacterium]|nr:class I SAM-dependent methyltransferase [Acidimicrobiales bacterium]
MELAIKSGIPQLDWDVLRVEEGEVRVSRMTVDVRWPALTAEYAQKIRSSLHVDGSVVDVGGGTGRLRHLIGTNFSRYINLEPSRTLLSQLGFDDSQVAIRGLGEFLPISSGSFSCVSAKSSLDHAFDVNLLISEVFRVLEPGGFVIIALVNESSWYKRVMPRQAKRRRERCEDHNFFFGVLDLENFLVNNGFEGVESTTYDYLRLPLPLEDLFCRMMPTSFLRWFRHTVDTVCRTVFPRSGGTMIVEATKPPLQ